ncbi:myosin regulatory light chain 2, skeletal muscle isoform-like [Seriola lalandi dorsalis]|nr:myosin regulatory light chain 2, skeletal muscle isoform-like [Seriola lalandi dorsalis]XP_056256975.1 myosin regulatory light chain 2, skeletal muscle [Seriola aureovittata]
MQADGGGQKEGGEPVSSGPTSIYVPNVLISPRGTANLQHGPSAISLRLKLDWPVKGYINPRGYTYNAASHCLLFLDHPNLHSYRLKMAPKKAKRRQAAGDGGSSNVFSMFEQSQIQEYKEAFTIIDQNRDGIISKDDLRDVLASMGQLNVKNEELEAMIKEASGPINFTVFLTMFGEKLKGADPEDVILSSFKVLDPEGTGSIKKEFLEELLTTQCDRFTPEEIKNMWAAFPPDVAGNVDYKNICYVITHGEEKEE